MEMIFEGLKLLIVIWVLFDMANFIGELMGEVKPIFKSRLIAIIYNLIYYVMNCDKCFSFWFSLIWSGDLFSACVIALIFTTIKGLEHKIKKGKTEL